MSKPASVPDDVKVHELYWHRASGFDVRLTFEHPSGEHGWYPYGSLCVSGRQTALREAHGNTYLVIAHPGKFLETPPPEVGEEGGGFDGDGEGADPEPKWLSPCEALTESMTHRLNCGLRFFARLP